MYQDRMAVHRCAPEEATVDEVPPGRGRPLLRILVVQGGNRNGTPQLIAYDITLVVLKLSGATGALGFEAIYLRKCLL